MLDQGLNAGLFALMSHRVPKSLQFSLQISWYRRLFGRLLLKSLQPKQKEEQFEDFSGGNR